jgi:hypothetical protein
MEGTEGGGWQGIDVTYSAGGVRRILQVDNDLLICGPIVQSKCGGTPFPTAAPSGFPRESKNHDPFL